MTIRKFALRVLKNFKIIPNKNLLKIRHEYYCGDKLNLTHPTTFNEKICWLKLYFHVPLLTQLADKYLVRSYVSEKIGDQYLNELYKVYYKVEDINFDELPNKFVLKGVHGSSLNLLVKDKSKLDRSAAIKTMNKWMKHCQYKKVGYEWAYKDIEPKIIAEKYLEEAGKEVIFDYKFFCFNGEPKFVQIDMERGIVDYRCYYDLEWKKQEFSTIKNVFYPGNVDKPSNFDEMVQLAKELSNRLPFTRVDFYSIEGKTIFGEITFYPADGKKNFIPNEYNKILGSYIELPKRVEEQIITVF